MQEKIWYLSVPSDEYTILLMHGAENDQGDMLRCSCMSIFSSSVFRLGLEASALQCAECRMGIGEEEWPPNRKYSEIHHGWGPGFFFDLRFSENRKVWRNSAWVKSPDKIKEWRWQRSQTYGNQQRSQTYGKHTDFRYRIYCYWVKGSQTILISDKNHWVKITALTYRIDFR
jgi:hypothetical protein